VFEFPLMFRTFCMARSYYSGILYKLEFGIWTLDLYGLALESFRISFANENFLLY
jgi:hypothetical protein